MSTVKRLCATLHISLVGMCQWLRHSGTLHFQSSACAVRIHTHTHSQLNTLRLTCRLCLLLPRIQPHPDIYCSVINKWVYLFMSTPPGTRAGKQSLGPTDPFWNWGEGFRIPPGAILFIKLHAEPLNRCRSSNAVVLTRYRVMWPYTSSHQRRLVITFRHDPTLK